MFILAYSFVYFLAWRELHFREITASEFIEKIASLKGDIAHFMAQEGDDARVGEDFELQEPPMAVPLGITFNLEYENNYMSQYYTPQRLNCCTMLLNILCTFSISINLICN